MAIDFSPARWEKVRETYRLWWAGELGRPIIPVELIGRDPGRTKPNVPLLAQATCHDLSISPEDLIDRFDYELSLRDYCGDAFPYINMDVFGPGVISAMLGAKLDNRSGQVWFFPPDDRPIAEIHLEYDPDNVWLNRLKEIYAAGMKRWQGQVLMSMTDLGGNLDIVSTFCPGEKLLYDLYDHPEEVIRLVWEAHELWHKIYNELNEVLQPVNPGFSDWSNIYSDQPFYILQSDFSYMISPKMFQQFALPELEASCKRLSRSFYHLDGVGQLPHQAVMLGLDDLDGMQWVPGDGKPGYDQWPDVYRKIQAAGKKIQVMLGGFDVLEAVVEQVGTPNNIHHRVFQLPISQRDEVLKRLAQFGVR